MPMPGVRVMVPLGKKSITGIVYRRHTGELPQHVTIKSVLQVLDNTPIVSEKQIRLWEWLSDYYMCTLGEVLSAALPAGIIDDDYTALTMQLVRLHSRFQDASAMGSLLEGLKRAKAQEKLLRCFLSMAGEGGVVERRELLERSGVSSSVLRTMIDKQIFDENQRVISRLRRYAGTKQLPNPLDWQQQNALNAIGESWKTKDV